MRVITGEARGRRLEALEGKATRPTSDKVKGAAFSILFSRFDLEGARLLDLFAGSGALGIEALSRGAAHVTFVEYASAAADVILRNLQKCRFLDRSTVLRSTVAVALARLQEDEQSFDGILLDPPYKSDLIAPTLTAIGNSTLCKPGAWVLCEHHEDEPVAETYGTLRLTHQRTYGYTALALFVNH